ncbi:hypothetical protein AM1_C0261 (plasmid) [Acaryochloris marina MBIC11017]|uniref:Uncharacterized protein n=1 Tax=Acaryochloris marina (strain MBIC 11017) TaxID=329726 RepID=A8ZMZ2_ACAM1|nr:hypothetical protein AM1_C0261 [Acaryochloris marina MBIC11017]
MPSNPPLKLIKILRASQAWNSYYLENVIEDSNYTNISWRCV